jgi:hypothetical protein
LPKSLEIAKESKLGRRAIGTQQLAKTRRPKKPGNGPKLRYRWGMYDFAGKSFQQRLRE